MASKRKQRKIERKYKNQNTRSALMQDLSSVHPVGGKFLKVGKSEILLTRTTQKDEFDNPIYVGTVVKRRRFSKRKVERASHILIKPMN